MCFYLARSSTIINPSVSRHSSIIMHACDYNSESLFPSSSYHTNDKLMTEWKLNVTR